MMNRNSIVTNMTYIHTYSTRHVDLITTLILASYGQLFQLASDMIYRANIGIPIWIDVVGGGSHCSRLLFRDIRLIESMPTFSSSVIPLEANLAEDHGVAIVPLGVVVAVVKDTTLLTSSTVSKTTTSSRGTSSSCAVTSHASSASESSCSSSID
jgi:phage tail protein X